MSGQDRTYYASSLRTSRDGVDFISGLEEGAGRSEHVYWPGHGSGVTIGPGYDFFHRSAGEIQRDLESVGVPRLKAMALSEGAGLSGTRAQDFAKRTRDVVILTAYQQQSLLQRTIPAYEAIVKRNVRVQISQQQFDALVALTYNPGTSITSITNAINRGKPNDAIRDWSSRTNSGGAPMAGLATRRKKEIDLFLSGKYR